MSISIKGLVSTHRLPPERLLLHGPSKTGKTTMVCSAPGVVALDVEGRMAHVDVPAWEIGSWESAIEALRVLARESHDYRYLVVDSASYLEKHLKAYIVSRHFGGNAANAEDYARWQRLAINTYWPMFFSLVEELGRSRGMGVLITAHTTEKEFRSLQGQPYHVFIPDLCGKSPALFVHWSQAVGFVSKDDAVVKVRDGRKEIERVVTSGRSVLHLEHDPRFISGNSYGINRSMELDWHVYDAARRSGWDRRASLAREIEDLLSRADEETARKVRAYIGSGHDVDRMEAAASRLRVILDGEVRQTTGETEERT